jgi:hypothetical protein
MKPLAAIAATLVIAIIAIYFWLNRASSEMDAGASGNSSEQRVITDRARVSQPAPIMGRGEAARDAMKTSTRYREAYAKSRDLWAFAHELLPAAGAGHADAQFYLSKAIDHCAHDNKMFFEHRGATLNLEDGLQFAAQRHLSLDLAQRVYDRCHKFLEQDASELGSAADWLARSTDAGYSPAQATTAEQMLVQDLLKNAANASGVPVPDQGAPAVENRMSPRELLQAALTSGDAEVLFEIGETHAMLNPTASAETEATERYAWWLVACQRGLDCGANADWIMSTCSVDPQCASYTDPADYLRSLAGDQWSEVQQRAVEISQKLDGHQWSDLGLGL